MAAFAKELYDNRLSVLQTNNDQETGFLLTEQDELEYEKLRTSLSKMPRQQHYAEEDKIELPATHQFIHQHKEQQQQTIHNEDQRHYVVDLQLNEEEDDEEEEQPQQSDLRQQHDRKESTASMNTSNCSCASRLSRFKELLDVDLGVVDILEQEENQEQQPQQQQRVKATKSLGLFGSLRQVTNRTRSQSASGGIRGLVRSLSTTVHRSSTSPSLSQLSQKMTPAAVAAIHHHTGQDGDDDDDDFKESGKGMRMLSQLVGRVRRSSRRGTKRINMDTPSSPTTIKSNERSRIVRRTIIYVPPDTENFMKTIEQPAFGHTISSTTTHHKSSLSSSSPSSSIDTSIPSQDNQLNGIELREMSDGSVSWGIVKKEGNRKSFYDPSNRESKYAVEEQDDDGDDINSHLLELLRQQHPANNTNLVSSTPPPPIPKRSPQRQQQQQQAAQHISTISHRNDSSTTDVYYAPNETLPSLLQMISEQERLKHSPSVEEQLDEVIRAFSCSSDE